jgi:hypothetical protein
MSSFMSHKSWQEIYFMWFRTKSRNLSFKDDTNITKWWQVMIDGSILVTEVLPSLLIDELPIWSIGGLPLSKKNGKIWDLIRKNLKLWLQKKFLWRNVLLRKLCLTFLLIDLQSPPPSSERQPANVIRLVQSGDLRPPMACAQTSTGSPLLKAA